MWFFKILIQFQYTSILESLQELASRPGVTKAKVKEWYDSERAMRILKPAYDTYTSSEGNEVTLKYSREVYTMYMYQQPNIVKSKIFNVSSFQA